ncbi:Cytoplasmic GTPase/eEF2-like protein (ribosomal biogenesis), partial [Linderina pennispora]
MVAIVEQLPSPASAQPVRLPPLLHGEAKSARSSSSSEQETKPKNPVERALYECAAGSKDEPLPLVAYVGKIVSVPRMTLPEFSVGTSQRDRMTMSADEMRARGRDAIRRELALNRASTGTPLSALSGAMTPASGAETPMVDSQPQAVSIDSLTEAVKDRLEISSDAAANEENDDEEENADPDAKEEEVLVGFGRIYSGTLRVGDTVWAMQPKYDAKKANAQNHVKQITVRALYMMMGREFVSLPEVPAGNVFGIRGLAGAILKSGTLASDPKLCPNLAAMHTETHPIVRVALEPVNPQDMGKLAHGLELLNMADPCVQVILQATGERVLVTAGELHLERCLKDLRERFAQCEIHVSEPIVPFKEGIVRQPAQPGVVLGEMGASGQSLAIISNTSNTTDDDDEYGKPAEGVPRGQVSVTTSNGLVTIKLQVEPLPPKVVRFLMRHESDIQRVVSLSSSSQRHKRLTAAADVLAQELEEAEAALAAGAENISDDEGGETPLPKPSRASELGPWLQARLRS